MSFFIAGTGGALPEQSVTNETLSTFLDTSDEWIRSRTGIGERRICIQEDLLSLATKAAQTALAQSGVPAAELDLILCATVQGDYIIPSLACQIQREIGAGCPAFDLNAACTGFVYALDVAAAYFARGYNHILVVAADAMSRQVDWRERSTCVLFGDGAGAVVLSKGEGLLSIKLTASGNLDILKVRGREGNCPFLAPDSRPAYLEMQGQELYRFAVGCMAEDVKAVLAMAGVEEREVTFLLAHQANRRILEAARQRLGIDEDKYVSNIHKYGNTSAASIPLLLHELVDEGRLSRGDLLVLTAFGGGLTSGAAVIRY
ncbi:MAG: ketoacyl-ACP synthase III [Clostridiales bacterium]|nr:ketoacyl-ACP synthase III [Clostridiales bacterium]